VDKLPFLPPRETLKNTQKIPSKSPQNPLKIPSKSPLKPHVFFKYADSRPKIQPNIRNFGVDTAPHESAGEEAGAQETALNSAGQRQTKARGLLWELARNK
jgi:hypothetical protein